MNKMNNENLKKINGGGINWGVAAGIGAAVSFVIGIIDGLINPKKCNG